MNHMHVAPRLDGNRLDYDIAVSGPWQELFNLTPFRPGSGGLYQRFGETNRQRDRYDVDLAELPASIAVIPFLCNILPVVWCSGAEVEVDELDRDFAGCLEELRAAFQRFYPELEFSGGIRAGRLVDNWLDTPAAESIVLYSGGVDATFSMLGNLALRPHLVCIRGSDIYFSPEEDAAWAHIGAQNRDIAARLGLGYGEIESTFKAFLRDWKLNPAFASKVRDNWWHGFQHGLALLGLAAPLAWLRRSKRIFISSSFSFKDARYARAASHPSLDETLRFFGCRISHYDYTVSRSEKVAFICRQQQMLQTQIPLRVCWEVRDGRNCCRCEKCLRTIFAIHAEDRDPVDFGFPLDAARIDDIVALIGSDGFEKAFVSFRWTPFLRRLPTSRARDLPHVQALLAHPRARKLAGR